MISGRQFTTKANTGNKKGISGSTLKIIAVSAMIIDHFSAVVLDRILHTDLLMKLDGSTSYTALEFLSSYNFLYYLAFFMRVIGRFGFPLFVFLLIEGFTHTRSRLAYALRLSLFALLSEIPFDLAFNNDLFYNKSQNVFFTLALGVYMLMLFRIIAEKVRIGTLSKIGFIIGIISPALYFLYTFKYSILSFWKSLTIFDTNATFLPLLFAFSLLLLLSFAFFWIRLKKFGQLETEKLCMNIAVLFFTMFVANLLHTDYSAMGILTIAIMYIYRSHKVTAMSMGCLTLTAMNFMEISAFFMIIPISKYNGTRGMRLKYFFYLFYPVHLLLLYLVCVYTNLL